MSSNAPIDLPLTLPVAFTLHPFQTTTFDKLIPGMPAALNMNAPFLRPAPLTDQQLGQHYADLWTATNSPLLDRVFQHIASQEQRIKELQK
jgi:hypothetical protein